MPLQYVGRNPDSNAILAPKSYADAQASTKVVTNSYISTTINAQTPNLVTIASGYVTAQDNLRAKKVDVTSADATYLSSSARNAPGGVTGLSSGGFVDSAQLPGALLTDRAIRCYSVSRDSAPGVFGAQPSSTAGANGLIYLGSGATRRVTTTGLREYRLASVTIPDPGYAWRPLPFAFVYGGSIESAAPATRSVGTGSYGLLVVMPPAGAGEQVYGIGIGTGCYAWTAIPVLPYGASGQTPSTVPALTGSLQLDLYGCCWTGNNYTYLGNDLSYWVLVVPAL